MLNPVRCRVPIHSLKVKAPKRVLQGSISGCRAARGVVDCHRLAIMPESLRTENAAPRRPNAQATSPQIWHAAYTLSLPRRKPTMQDLAPILAGTVQPSHAQIGCVKMGTLNNTTHTTPGQVNGKQPLLLAVNPSQNHGFPIFLRTSHFRSSGWPNRV